MHNLQYASNPAVPLLPWVSSSSTGVSSYSGDLFAGERTQAGRVSGTGLLYNGVYVLLGGDIGRYRGLGIEQRLREVAGETAGASHLSGLASRWERDFLVLAGGGLLDVRQVTVTHPATLHVVERALGETGLPRFRFDLGNALPIELAKQPTSSSQQQGRTEGLDPVELVAKVKEALQINDRQLKAITGIGKTTLHNWRHGKSRPRPSSLDPLLRVFALLRMVVEKVGLSESAIWFRSGSPSPLSLLLKGDLDGVEHAVANRLFADLPLQREVHAAFAPDEEFEVKAPPPTAPLQRSRRAARRMKLPPQ